MATVVLSDQCAKDVTIEVCNARVLANQREITAWKESEKEGDGGGESNTLIAGHAR